jgi:DNA-directed RNA polymerase subunit RPC12/RpoP
MSPLHLHHGEKLKCPYKGCGKSFDRLATVTESTPMQRQTYYACPHCMSKIEVITENFKIVDIRPMEYGKVFNSPAKCAHYTGFLSAISNDIAIPDDCLVCPKILQCGIKRRQ